MELGVLFLAKKIVSFMLYPLSIALLLALAGFALFKRYKRVATMLFVTSFVWIFLISSSFFSNWLLAGLESEYKPIKELPKGVEYIVLLGGDSKRRAWEALRLYRLATNAKIIMVTSHGEQAKVIRAIQSGASNYILKPLHEDKLADVIDKLRV